MPPAPRRLSVAMIVRDEQDTLEGCLRAIAPVARQMVVVDTGSVDETPRRAAQCGAEVFSFDWCDDFAAARNAALAHCTGDWILVLDADERIAEGDLDALAELVQAPPESAWRMTTRNYTASRHLSEFVPVDQNDPMANGYAGWFPSSKVRLFPRRPDIRFEGEVHELVNASIAAAGLPVQDCAIPLHHYPLDRSDERIAQKRELYLRLGEAKVARTPGDPKAWEELAEQYIELDQFAQAVRAYRHAVEAAPGEARLLAGLGSALALAGSDEAAAMALDLALRNDPHHLTALRNRAVLALRAGSQPEAEAFARRFIALEAHDSEIYRYLAIALAGQQRNAEALEAVQRAVRLDPRNTEALMLEAWLTSGVG